MPRIMLLALFIAAPLGAQEPGRVKLDFTGLVLLNGFYTSDSTNNSDLPQFVQRRSPSGRAVSGLGATVRQTRLRLLGSASQVAGGRLDLELDVDFFGGQQPSSGGRTFPVVRIRRAFGKLAWSRFAILAGQEAPPIVELNPSSLGALGLPSHAASGNLWLWLPQVRVGGALVERGPTRLSLEAAAIAPNGDAPQGLFLTQPDRAERSGRPSLESRLRLEWGEPDLRGELSVGGHLGWLRSNGDTLVTSRAAAVALVLPLGRYLEFRGEGFIGRAVAGLGGGGIGQNLGPNDEPVRTRGGWGQLLVRPGAGWELGGSWGLDDPEDDDLDAATGRRRNEVWAAEAQWRRRPLVLGAEFRRLRTRYGGGAGTVEASHVNLAAGVEF